MSRSVVIAYGVAAITMAALDAAWIGLVAGDLYREELGSVVGDSPRWAPALLFYLVFWSGLCHFVIGPAVRTHDPLPRVAAEAAWFGLVAYGTWALTGLAVLADMTVWVAVSDLLWGPVMSLLTATLAVLLGGGRLRNVGESGAR